MFAVVDFQNLKVVHFKKFFWWRTCQGKKNGHTNYMLNYRMKDLSFQSIHFLGIWLLIIENVYGLIWASFSSHKMCMKEENNKKRNHLSFLKIRTKFWWAFTPEKFMFKNWKWNQRSYASFLFIFLPCSTEYNQGIFCMFHCPNVGKWHNSELKLPKYLLKAK